ncbi:hypothetical protein LAZ67_12000019 [Cordylochernes scorpioides]|uniref:Mos1 transposase HTH domain-containing protein n=1 Tax=Cordylochernes scorpioides TaxID=51811 RepID=A0ABY6L071_9ARAC|nr:hypothetical protein LAZ67_12000019 [Cordylochernes scorpioides]
MDRSIEQRYAIKFCFRLGKTDSKTFAMITEAYKEDALSRTQVFRWFKEFKTRNDLDALQRQRRVDVCRGMLNELENNPDFSDNVVTGDESWTFQYDPETKAQSSEWHTPASPRPKKARMSKSRVKTMLIMFFDKQGLIHKEFVLQVKTVNAEFYKEVLWRLHKRKRQDLAQRWRLHHDNAPAHSAFLVTSYSTRIGVEVLPQPPYSPDMSPPDLFPFPKVKRCLKGHRFDDIPNIQPAVTKALTGITPTDYSGAYEAWKTSWQRCVDAQGEEKGGGTVTYTTPPTPGSPLTPFRAIDPQFYEPGFCYTSVYAPSTILGGSLTTLHTPTRQPTYYKYTSTLTPSRMVAVFRCPSLSRDVSGRSTGSVPSII